MPARPSTTTPRSGAKREPEWLPWVVLGVFLVASGVLTNALGFAEHYTDAAWGWAQPKLWDAGRATWAVYNVLDAGPDRPGPAWLVGPV